jgi:ATP-dependent Clp protease, protease subunit
MVLDNSDGGERFFDIYSRLLVDRIIFLQGSISDNVASVITAQLLYLEAKDAMKPVHMYINSPGGLVSAGLAIFDTMQYVRCPVSTVCIGQAASMGSLLLAGGENGMRFSLPNSRIMLHQPSGGAEGMASDIQIQAEEILKLRRKLNKLYVLHTCRKLAEIELATDRDSFFSAREAQEFGIIDSILQSNHSVESSRRRL